MNISQSKGTTMKPTVTLLTTLLLAPLVWPLSTRAGDWPGWLGPNRDGHSPDTGLLKQWPVGGPNLLWKVDTLGTGWSSPSVANDRVYITGVSEEKQMLLCFDLNGKTVWKVVQGPQCSHRNYPGARSTPTVDGARIYVTGGEGLVTCHKAATGEVLWKREMISEMGGKVGAWRYAESVLILDQMAIVTPGGNNAIVALDKTTGQTVWKSDVSGTAGYSSCIVLRGQGSTLVVNGSQSGLIAVDAKTGRKVWTNPFTPNMANVPTPAYADGYLFWAVGYGKGAICFKVSQTGGTWNFEQAWTSKDLTCHPGNYVIAQGCVYGKGRGLTCLDLKTGMKLWTVPWQEIGCGQVSWADGRLYVFGDENGKVSLVEPSAAGGRLVGKFQIEGTGKSWAYPVVTGGRLYLRYGTNLYCYNIKASVR
jgi:outer membrane protein assembly factor BamB